MRDIPFLQPSFPSPAEIVEDYAAIMASGTFTNGGPREREFASAISHWVGGDVRTVLTSSATTGLQLACSASCQSDRRWVLVPSFTFPAGPMAIRWCGYEPFFIDVDIDSWQMDPTGTAAVLRRGARDVAAILLTPTFGVVNNAIGVWEALAEHYGVPLLIDMAAGFGSTYLTGEPAGARGACEVFSFHATKTLAVGEGGAVVSRDHDLIERIHRARNFGFDASRRIGGLGMNAKLAELPCAIGLRQLATLPRRLAHRRALYDIYVDELRPLGLEFQPGGRESALAFVPALAPGPAQRDVLVAGLGREGIGCRVYYNPPVHQQPFFSAAPTETSLPITLDFASRVISLPMSDFMTENTVRQVVGVVADVLAHA